MIARMWHGMVKKEQSESYYRYVLNTGLRDYRKVRGNKTAFLLTRDERSVTHFYVLSFWDDIESIRQFAGEDYEKAVYYPEDEKYLLEFEPLVKHFDVWNGLDEVNNDEKEPIKYTFWQAMAKAFQMRLEFSSI